jgi:hypothetical protein
VEIRFTTDDPDFTNPSGSSPSATLLNAGVEVGFIDESTSTRVAIASVIPGNQTIALGSAAPAFSSLVNSLIDGDVTMSLGAFLQFQNVSDGTRFTTGYTLDQTSLLTITVNGAVSDRVPEPATLPLLLGALLAAVAVIVLRRQSHPGGSDPGV